jgi:hypothetical protein
MGLSVNSAGAVASLARPLIQPAIARRYFLDAPVWLQQTRKKLDDWLNMQTSGDQNRVREK